MGSRKKEALRAELANDLEAFLARGGTIERVDHTANKGWRGRKHTPMTVTQARQEHRWRTPAQA